MSTTLTCRELVTQCIDDLAIRREDVHGQRLVEAFGTVDHIIQVCVAIDGKQGSENLGAHGLRDGVRERVYAYVCV